MPPRRPGWRGLFLVPFALLLLLGVPALHDAPGTNQPSDHHEDHPAGQVRLTILVMFLLLALARFLFQRPALAVVPGALAGTYVVPAGMKRAPALVAVPAALAVSLAACGGGDGSGDSKTGGSMAGHSMNGHSMSMSASPSTGGGQAARHNQQDVMFAQMMTPHHRQAIEMADLAATRASSPQVKSLAADIRKEQTPEIQRLSGRLKGWGASVPSPGMSGMGGMQHGMDGMMSEKAPWPWPGPSSPPASPLRPRAWPRGSCRRSQRRSPRCGTCSRSSSARTHRERERAR